MKSWDIGNSFDQDSELRSFMTKWMLKAYEAKQDFLKLSPENQKRFVQIVASSGALQELRSILSPYLQTVPSPCPCIQGGCSPVRTAALCISALCIELAGEFDEGNLRGVPQAEAEGRAVRCAKARADVLIGGVDLVQAA